MLPSCLQGCCSNLHLACLYFCMCNRRETQSIFALILIIFLSTNTSLRPLSQRNSLGYISRKRKRHFRQHQQPPLGRYASCFSISSPCSTSMELNHFAIQSHFEFRRSSYYCSDELYSTLKISLCVLSTTGPKLLHCPGCYNCFGQAQVDP